MILNDFAWLGNIKVHKCALLYKFMISWWSFTHNCNMVHKMAEVNQQVIADKLKISRTTVSRCFTNHPGINPETRAQVFSLAAQMGYHYMENRKNGGEDTTLDSTVAVLICSDQEEYNRSDYRSPGMELLPGVSEFALLNQQQLDTHFVDPAEDSLSGASYRMLLHQRKTIWKGILMLYPFPPGVAQGLMKRFPCVSLVEQFGTPSLDCVDVDHYRGISHLMELLLEHGHRRIGFFSRYYQVEACWAFRRYSAYAEKMARMGLNIREEDVINVRPDRKISLEEGFDQAARQTRDGVTAWVCAADHQAYDLIAELSKRGLSVPKEVSVTGFDGIETPRQSPQLTTMSIPYRQIGYSGMQRLSDVMERRFATTQHILLECQLREGTTVAKSRV
jgi:DNA-binding LacI/PurR family transcriptional regulator